MLECLQCNDLFVPEAKELFCCDECRFKFWKNKSKKGNTDDHLEDLKIMVEKVRREAKSLKFHFDRLENDYSDWEDRCVAVENRIREVEEQVGLEEAELDNLKQIKRNQQTEQEADFNALDDLFAE